jgi:sigma-B regulation protein RsbU (phosphoserine phosphatase)
MIKNRGIAFKFIVFILSSSFIIFLPIFTYNYLYSKGIIVKNARENAANLTDKTANRIEAVLSGVEKVPLNLASFLENSSYTEKNLLSMLRSVVENNPEIYGAAIAFEPFAFKRGSMYFSPYYYKKGKEIGFSFLGGDDYRYFYWDWYQIPKEINGPLWSEPYYDEGGGGIIMATYSVPFYENIGGKRRFMGVVTADISLEWLRDMVSSIRIYRSGYGVLISRNGTFVTHPDKEMIMNETIFGVAEGRGDRGLREIGREMIKGASGFVPFRSLISERKGYLQFSPIKSSGWSLAVFYPEDEMMADIRGLTERVLSLGMLGTVLLLGVVVFISRSITRPIRRLSRAAEEIASGDLDAEIPPAKYKDEVGKLSETFIYMEKSLKKYIAELTETTAAKERIEGELNVAREIQMSILPKIFPPFPDRTEFDIYAVIEPAREVGGDFYDFFFVDDVHFCFAVGDVSGKGVPASLFMAITKTLHKVAASKGIRPDEILKELNHELSQSNENSMFVTIFCGVLDIRTGDVFYANGGHNPPILMKKGGEMSFLDLTGDIVVGVLEGATFKLKRFVLDPGDALFMYTDGVTEAMNTKDELYSCGRLEGALTARLQQSVQDMVVGITEDVIFFSGGAEQADDITIMALRYRGKGGGGE